MTVVAGSVVDITTADLPVEDLLRIAHGAPVALAPDAVERIRASRAIVDALVDGPALIYGLNTGLGHLRDERVPRETLRRYQELIVAGHEGAIGDPLPTEVVRAAMAVRLNGIARGGAGASLPVAEGLAALLNAGVTPVVAHVGLGRRLGPHAHGGDRPSADRARAGRGGRRGRRGRGSPAASRPRARRPGAQGWPRPDLGQRCLHRPGRGRRRARGPPRARSPTSCSPRRSRSMSGNPSVLDPAVLAAKPVPGQLAAGAEVRAFLRGSELFTPGVPRSVQDPLSFRVGPAGPRRAARVHRDPRGRGRDRAQRHGRQPARRRRLGADAEQRQLPPDGARARPRRPAAGHRPRRPARGPAAEPPVVVVWPRCS